MQLMKILPNSPLILYSTNQQTGMSHIKHLL